MASISTSPASPFSSPRFSSLTSQYPLQLWQDYIRHFGADPSCPFAPHQFQALSSVPSLYPMPRFLPPPAPWQSRSSSGALAGDQSAILTQATYSIPYTGLHDLLVVSPQSNWIRYTHASNPSRAICPSQPVNQACYLLQRGRAYLICQLHSVVVDSPSSPPSVTTS